MKNVTIGIFMAAVICLLYSCSKAGIINGSGKIVSEYRPQAAFNFIQEDGSINVVVVADTAYSVIVQSDDNVLPYLQTDVDGNVLTIKFKRNFLIKGDQTTVYVHCPTLSGAGIDGSGSITSNDSFSGQEVNLRVDGSGTMHLALTAAHVTAILSGSGDITLEGVAQQYDANVQGSGNIRAYDLIADNATAVINGSGNAFVYAFGNLQATIKGSGNIYFKGHPTVVSSMNGSGGIYQQ